MELEEWKRVLGALESFIPYYERLNHLVTFFMLIKWRGAAARLAARDMDVLEVGSGPGHFSKLLEARSVLCLDPSERMLRWSMGHLRDGRFGFVRGMGERIPLRDGTFDRIFCLFSFRDFVDRREGAIEMRRVLRDGGKLVILDLMKPPSGSRKRVMDLWMRHGTKVVLGLMVPGAKGLWAVNPYELLYETYEKFESPESLKALVLGSGFTEASVRDLGFGASMLVATK